MITTSNSSVKIYVRIGEVLSADEQNDGTHKLPVKTEIRRAIGKSEGETVTVRLEERIA